MGLSLGIAEDQAQRTTRQTIPGAKAAATVGTPGYDQYGGSPMFSRLAVRGLSSYNLETLDILQLDPFAAIELLPIIFPDAGLAVHNILRLGNPGWEIVVYHAVSGKPDRKATMLCAEMMERANRGVDCDIPGAMGGADSLINSLLYSAYLKGAVCVEAVLDETLSFLDDIVPVDPFTIEFEERKEKRGRYRIYQRQGSTASSGQAGIQAGGEKVAPVPTLDSHESQSSTLNANLQNRVEINPNLLTYVPLDETLYGRSMVAPALQLLIFWTRFYISLQVFLHNVAFGDKDGEIDTALLLTILDRNMPASERAKWEQNFWPELVKLVSLFANDYKANGKRDPNSAMIHSDLLKMSSLGTARTAYPIKEVMEVCKREVYAALKMLPVLMGANDTTTETHATVQMQVFMSGLNYIQGAVKHAIERALLTGLRAAGYAKNVRVELAFAELSMTDRLKLAQAVEIELRNEITKRTQGFQTQDESSENATGSPAVADGPDGSPAKNPQYERPTAMVDAEAEAEGSGSTAPANADATDDSADVQDDPEAAKGGKPRKPRKAPAKKWKTLSSATPYEFQTNRPSPAGGFAGSARASSARFGKVGTR